MILQTSYMLAIMKAWAAGYDSHDIAKALKIKEDTVIDALAEIRASNSAATEEGQNLTPKAARRA